MAAFTVSDTRVEYLERGRGEPVILLHSSASSGLQWRSLMDLLSVRYRVMAPDFHGCGGTAPWPGHGPFRLEHEARMVCVLLGRAGGRAHLVGHSFGGAVALHIARTRPDLLSSVTLIEPVAFHLLRHRDPVALVQIIDVANGVANALACGDYFGGIARFVDYWSGPGTWESIRPEKRAALAARLAKVALDFEATLNEPAALEDLREMAVPALVVAGTSSPRPTRRICELLAHTLPEVELATVDGAGHMAPLTHCDAVNALVARHVAAVHARGAETRRGRSAVDLAFDYRPA